MSNKKSKRPIVVRTKQQIEQGIKNVQEAQRLREFVKDKFYPLLLTATTSIDDSKYLLGSFSNMIMEQFLNQMRLTKFKDLELEKKLDPNSPQYQDYVKILAIFEDESVFSSRELIEGMKGEIEAMINNELKERKLDTLKTNFL